MQVKDVDIAELKPYDKNPRIIGNDAIDAVAASIKQFGFRQPIVVDENNVIIAGHTRYKAALKLNIAVVPIHVAVGLTPEQIKAYRIADNRLNELSRWDYDTLAEELAVIAESSLDMTVLGWDKLELDRLLGNEGVTVKARGDLDETIANDVKMIECPECGHKFPK